MKKENYIPKKEGKEKLLKNPVRTKERINGAGSFSERVRKTGQIKNAERGEMKKGEEIEKILKNIKNQKLSETQEPGLKEKEIIEEAYLSKEDVLAAAEESDANLTGEELKKLKTIEGRSRFSRLAAKGVKALYGIGTVLGIVAPLVSSGQDRESHEITKDPEDVKNKMEITVDARKDITPDDNTYFVNPSDIEGLGGPDDEGNKTENKIAAQEAHDQKIFDKHAGEWEQNHRYYVRDGEELKSVIRHSLSHLRDSFDDPRDLRNSINEIYDGVLNPQEIIDFHSFIVNGAPDGEDGAVNRKDVEYLQTIYNKIASAPSDVANDKLAEILASNSANKETGVDDKFGIATGEASQSLILEKLDHILKLAGSKGAAIETPQEKLAEMEIKEAPELRGYTSVIIEGGVSFDQGQAKSLETIVSKLNNFGDFQEVGDFIKNFETKDFDKIEIIGKDIDNGVNYDGKALDFSAIDDLGSGSYEIKAGNYDFSFDFLRTEGGKVKTIANFEANYRSEDGDIRITAGEAVRNQNEIDKNDPTKEGYVRSLTDFKLEAFGKVELEVGNVYKYENANEVGASAGDIRLRVGDWSLTANGFDGKYNTPEGNFDLGKVLDNVWNSNDGAKIGDLIDRFEFNGGPVKIENADGSVKIEYDGDNLFYNDFRIFKDAEGNFNFLNDHGDGAVYEGGFETYAKINGQNMETKDFINNLVYNGAEVMLNSPEAEVGVSVMGGFIEMNTGNIESKITAETLSLFRKDIDKTFQTIADKVEEFTSMTKDNNVDNMIDKGLALKTDVIDEIGDLIGRIKDNGEIEMKDWKISIDFKTLAENFKLIGNPDAASAVYKLDTFFSALGNDLGKISIDGPTVDGYLASDNKSDYICQNIWGKNADELTNDFKSRATTEFGAKLLEQPTAKIMSVIDATNNGSVEGLILSPDEVQLFYNFSKKLNPEGTNFIVYANANLGDNNQNQEAYVNLLDTGGKEHLNAGAEWKDLGGVGLIATRVVSNAENTVVKALAGINLEFIKLQDLSLGFTDGDGHNYQIVHGDNFFKLANAVGAEGKLDLVQRAIDNKWILPVPQVELGADITHKIIGEHGGKTTLEGSALLATNYLNTSVNLSFRAETELDNLIGLPLTVGGKINASKMMSGERYSAGGEVFIRWDIGKNISRAIGR